MKCPTCGNEVEGKFCTQCGTKMPEAKKVNKCTNCGNEFEGNFCTQCGTKANLNENTPKQVQNYENTSSQVQPVQQYNEVNNSNNPYDNELGKQNKKKLKGWQLALIIVGAVLVIFVIFIVSCSSCSSSVNTTNTTKPKPTMPTTSSTSAPSTMSSTAPTQAQTTTQAVTSASESTQKKQTGPYELGETFVFDELEITLGKDIPWVTLENEFSDLNGSKVLCIPITVKNISKDTHGLNMFFKKAFGPSGKELEDVASYFMDDDIDFAGDLRSGASTQSIMHVLYEKDGEYVIEFSKLGKDKVEVKFNLTINN